MNNKIKNGVSLVILTITIIVMIILAGSAVSVTTNIISNSQKATFSEDLIQIEDAVKAYYIDNNTLPIKKDDENMEIHYTLLDIKNLPDFQKTRQSVLNAEITKNFDDDNNNIFYQIDLSKIDVTSTTRGYETQGDLDIYVVSRNTRTIYYLNGEKIGDNIYFSTVNLIDSDKIKEEQVEDNSTTSITTMTNVKVKKSTNLYTNKLVLTIEANPETEETLYYTFGDETSIYLIENNIITLPEAIKEESDLIEFINNKTVTIQKIKDSIAIQSLSISIENLDIISPIIENTIDVKEYASFNTIKLTDVSDAGGSGLKELRYEYLTIQEGETEVPYATEVTIDEEYLLSVGKKADISLIKLPKNIKEISVIAVDNAGNYSDILECIIE